MSPTVFTNIGAPQGCVLSPVLSTIYTDAHRSTSSDIRIIKYADDTAIVGLFSPGETSSYQASVAAFVQQCDRDDLRLNVTKTKEMVVDFRREGRP